MNYEKIYTEYMQYIKTLKRKRSDRFYEEHHILPKSLGGDNSKKNRVLLTPREHYLAHLTLMKIYESRGGLDYKKMVYAFMSMNWDKYGKRYSGSSRYYEKCKRLASKMQSDYLTPGTPTYDKYYENFLKGAAHIKDKSSPEFQAWKEKTVKRLPQKQDKCSQEYKDWYSKVSGDSKPCKMDKKSEEYQAWHKAMMEGKRKHKKIWMYSEDLKKSMTVDIELQQEYETRGWRKGRK
jgi:hypothetical protein